MLWLNNLVYKIQIWKWAVKNESEVAQACPTLCDSMDYSPPGSSGHAILQAIVLEWVAISFSRRSSQPKDRTRVSRIAGRCFTIWAVKGKCPSTSACSKKKKKKPEIFGLTVEKPMRNTLVVAQWDAFTQETMQTLGALVYLREKMLWFTVVGSGRWRVMWEVSKELGNVSGLQVGRVWSCFCDGGLQ